MRRSPPLQQRMKAGRVSTQVEDTLGTCGCLGFIWPSLYEYRQVVDLRGPCRHAGLFANLWK